MNVGEIIEELRKVQGLDNFIILDNDDKKRILELEEERNTGVREAVNRKHTIAFSHDSTFREPAGKIVDGKVFPAVPFPEVRAQNVVSASPGYDVDAYLRGKIKLKKDEATLLVGFDGR